MKSHGKVCSTDFMAHFMNFCNSSYAFLWLILIFGRIPFTNFVAHFMNVARDMNFVVVYFSGVYEFCSKKRRHKV